MFERIIGQEDTKKYFMRAMEEGRLSHSYLFEGEIGTGKYTFALEVAKALLCENKEHPCCGKCKSCYMLEQGNHPDIMVVEKDTKVIKIDTIRNNIIQFMHIKPYQSNHKIVIVKAADSITTEGQNALLKTIEEPPGYGIVFLCCENKERLLPTIQSRCILLRFHPLTDKQMEKHLLFKDLPQDKQFIYTKFAQGSLGVMHQLIEDEDFLTRRSKSIAYINQLDKANLIDLYTLVTEIVAEKDKVEEILKFWLLWYRDILFIKSNMTDQLYYEDYQNQLLDSANKLTYNKVSQNIANIRKSLIDIHQNIYTLFVIENLLLSLKERKK